LIALNSKGFTLFSNASSCGPLWLFWKFRWKEIKSLSSPHHFLPPIHLHACEINPSKREVNSLPAEHFLCTTHKVSSTFILTFWRKATLKCPCLQSSILYFWISSFYRQTASDIQDLLSADAISICSDSQYRWV